MLFKSTAAKTPDMSTIGYHNELNSYDSIFYAPRPFQQPRLSPPEQDLGSQHRCAQMPHSPSPSPYVKCAANCQLRHLSTSSSSFLSYKQVRTQLYSCSQRHFPLHLPPYHPEYILPHPQSSTYSPFLRVQLAQSVWPSSLASLLLRSPSLPLLSASVPSPNASGSHLRLYFLGCEKKHDGRNRRIRKS